VKLQKRLWINMYPNAGSFPINLDGPAVGAVPATVAPKTENAAARQKNDVNTVGRRVHGVVTEVKPMAINSEVGLNLRVSAPAQRVHLEYIRKLARRLYDQAEFISRQLAGA
jgi:hypothetical protein